MPESRKPKHKLTVRLELECWEDFQTFLEFHGVTATAVLQAGVEMMASRPYDIINQEEFHILARARQIDAERRSRRVGSNGAESSDTPKAS